MSSSSATSSFRFIVNSDFHYRADGSFSSDKQGHVEKMLEIIHKFPVSHAIFTGDITDLGLGKASFYDRLMGITLEKILFLGQSILALCDKRIDYVDQALKEIPIGLKEDQFTQFMEHCYIPISRAIASVSQTQEEEAIRLCAGNHDTYSQFPYTNKAVLNFIKENYGYGYYSYEKEGVQFICCHLCPERSILPWLKKELDKTHHVAILFFHYNLQGPYSDFWSNSDKEAFRDFVIEYNQEHSSKIKAILLGHHHVSKIETWNGITVVNTGGSSFALCEYDKKNQTLQVQLISSLRAKL